MNYRVRNSITILCTRAAAPLFFTSITRLHPDRHDDSGSAVFDSNSTLYIHTYIARLFRRPCCCTVRKTWIMSCFSGRIAKLAGFHRRWRGRGRRGAGRRRSEPVHPVREVFPRHRTVSIGDESERLVLSYRQKFYSPSVFEDCSRKYNIMFRNSISVKRKKRNI